MTLKELRNEYCKIKGWRYIQFDSHTELQEYTLWLESKALSIGAVGQSFYCVSPARDNSTCKKQCGMCAGIKEVERITQ